jgi:hypothetical protein
MVGVSRSDGGESLAGCCAASVCRFKTDTYAWIVHAEGWYRDPYGIHEDRWVSDGQPTSLVRDQGTESRDEPPPGEPPFPLVPVAENELSDGQDLLRAEEYKRKKRGPWEGSGSLGIGFN